MTFKVDKEFILEAHKAACDGWKKKIEAKFPKVFEVGNVIGKLYNVTDTSYIRCLENGKEDFKTEGITSEPCLIIKNPYKLKVGPFGIVYDFVDVLYKNNTHSVLFFKRNLVIDEA